MPDAFFNRIFQAFTGEDRGARVQIWKVGIEELNRSPILGVGLGNYTEIYQFSDVYSAGPFVRRAHNTYLGTWVELGILGLALMLAALASHLLAARGIKATSMEGVILAAIVAACFGALVGAFFADRLWSKHFWLPWILLTWAIRLAREPQGSSTDLS
jgi:O-antigen ligase